MAADLGAGGRKVLSTSTAPFANRSSASAPSAGAPGILPWLPPVLLTSIFALFAALFVALAWVRSPREMDLYIYRQAMVFVLNGNSLYDYVFQYFRDGALQTLGFTYPPFASLLLRPLALLPELPTDVAWLAATFVGLFLLATALMWGLHREGSLARPALREPSTWTVNLLFTLALLLTVPALDHVLVGQVSLGLVLMVLVDMAFVPRRWRGILTGVAAAIKLTPLVFVAYLFLAREWRPAATAAGSFVSCSLVGFLVLPRESVAFWGYWVWHTSRVGDPAMEDNKSLLGFVAREAGLSGPSELAWLAAVAVVSVIGLWHALRLSRAGFPTRAAVVVGCVSLAASPFSWPHHLFWILLSALIALRTPSWRWRAWGAVILVLFNVFMLFVTFAPEGRLAPLTETPVMVIAACCLVGLPLPHSGEAQGRPREGVAVEAASPSGT